MLIVPESKSSMVTFRNCPVVYKYLATGLPLPMFFGITNEKGASAEIKSGHIFTVA